MSESCKCPNCGFERLASPREVRLLEKHIKQLEEELNTIVRDTHWLRIAQEFERENEILRDTLKQQRERSS